MIDTFKPFPTGFRVYTHFLNGTVAKVINPALNGWTDRSGLLEVDRFYYLVAPDNLVCGAYGVPLIILDMGSLMGGLVGETEHNFDAARQVISAMAGEGEVLMLGTCNSLANLSSAMRRRFRLGTFYFELPDPDERAAIWSVYERRYLNLNFDQLPPDNGWTGAEIRNCCDVADRLGLSLVEASQWIVPTSLSSSAEIEDSKRQADGRFLSASKPGVFRNAPKQIPGVQGAPTRRIGG